MLYTFYQESFYRKSKVTIKDSLNI